jgi:large subunit ribosomal protein L15
LGGLQKAIDAGRLAPGATVDGAALVAAGLLRRERHGIRLLAKGELKAALTISVAGASKAAVEAVEKAGGKVVLPAPKPAPETRGNKAARDKKKMAKPAQPVEAAAAPAAKKADDKKAGAGKKTKAKPAEE